MALLELKITYGSYVVGVGGSAILDGRKKFEFSEDFDSGVGRCAFRAIVRDTTGASQFKTALEAFEAAFVARDANLTITYGSTDFRAIVPSTNTQGFNTKSRWFKPGDEADTGRSRVLEVEITWGLPTPTDGVRQLGYSLSFSPARRRDLTVSGVVTALSTNNALQQLAASGMTTRINDIKTLVGGDGWEDVPELEQQNYDRNTKVVSFSKTFRELVEHQSSGTLDDSELSKQTLKIRVRQTAPGDAYAGVVRPVEIEVDYSAFVLMSGSASSQVNVKEKWASKILPHLLDRAVTTAGVTDYALVDADPTYDNVERFIAAKLQLLGFSSNLLEADLTTETSFSGGSTLKPVWDGDPLSRAKYDGPIDDVATTTERKVVRGNVTAKSLRKGDAGASSDQFGIFGIGEKLDLEILDPKKKIGGGGGAGFFSLGAEGDDNVFMGQRVRTRPWIWGIAPHQIAATEITTITTRQTCKIVAAPTPSGDGGTTGGSTGSTRSS